MKSAKTSSKDMCYSLAELKMYLYSAFWHWKVNFKYPKITALANNLEYQKLECFWQWYHLQALTAMIKVIQNVDDKLISYSSTVDIPLKSGLQWQVSEFHWSPHRFQWCGHLCSVSQQACLLHNPFLPAPEWPSYGKHKKVRHFIFY